MIVVTSNTIILITVFMVFFLLTYIAWRRYLWAAEAPHEQEDTCPYSLTEVFDNNHLINIPHQKGVQWLGDIFSRTAKSIHNSLLYKFPIQVNPSALPNSMNELNRLPLH